MSESKKDSVAQHKLKSHRKKMFYIALSCNLLAALLAFCALATSIASVASVEWSHFGEVNMTGLFRGCHQDTGDCFALDEVGLADHWLLAVRAFFIMMIVCGGTGCTFSIASFVWREKEKLGLAAAGLIFCGGLFGIVACAIYSMSTDDVIPEYHYGSGFALGWVSCWFFFLGGVLFGASAGTIDTYEPQSSA